MDQRLLLALALSMLVLIGYYLVFPPPATPPPAPAPVTQSEGAAPTAAPNGAAPAAAPGSATPVGAAPLAAAPSAMSQGATQAAPAEARRVRVETPLYVAEFNTRGATLSSFKLKDYRVAKENIDWGDLIPPLRTWLHKPVIDPEAKEDMAPPPLLGAEPLALRFLGEESLTRSYERTVFSSGQEGVRLSPGDTRPRTLVLSATTEDGLTVEKRFTFYPDTYIVDYKLAVANRGAQARSLRLASYFGEGPFGAQRPTAFRGHRGPVWRAENKLKTEDPDDVAAGLIVREPAWAGMSGPYFITATHPVSPISHANYESREVLVGNEKTWVAAYSMELPQAALEPGQMLSGEFNLYFGPKKVDDMTRFGYKLETSLDLTLDILAQPMLAMMRWFYGYTHNYGIAIILLTVVVRAVLFPLTYRGMLSIKRMQKLQPRMVALRAKFKNDKERLNKEMVAMYRKHKMNPLGGCLPIALQIPIFFALYSALLGAIELRHAPFVGWLTDLSAHDGLYVTPVLMGASMLVQQRMTPTAMDPTQARIMMWMPLVFMFFMINFPAGLVVYWLTSNTLSILQQFIINRIKVPEPQD